MAYVGFFKSEKNKVGLSDGWLWLSTTINQDADLLIKGSAGNTHYDFEVQGSTNIYCHDEAATEPITDGNITTSVFDVSEVEYSGPAGTIHNFTSETGFFTADQTLNLGTVWTIYYNAKASGVDLGFTATITWTFYKRDTGDNDTELWSKTVVGVGALYGFAGLNTTTIPQGMVTTDDRLRIEVSMGQQASK